MYKNFAHPSIGGGTRFGKLHLKFCK